MDFPQEPPQIGGKGRKPPSRFKLAGHQRRAQGMVRQFDDARPIILPGKAAIQTGEQPLQAIKPIHHRTIVSAAGSHLQAADNAIHRI